MSPDLSLELPSGRRPSARQERKEDFVSPKGNYVLMSFSPALTTCALHALAAALFDRQTDEGRTADNHLSRYSLAAIVLTVAAFEAGVNEILHSCGTLPNVDRLDLGKLLDRSLVKRYYAIARVVAGAELRDEDLETVIEVRNEIVHHVPRAIFGEGNVPAWLLRLHKMGVFVTSKHAPGTDLLLSQKLLSYGLAYWCYKSVANAARALAKALAVGKRTMVASAADFVADNFAVPTEIVRPELLFEFDAALGLGAPRKPV